jgi:phospholipid transport system substrate-binding protein
LACLVIVSVLFAGSVSAERTRLAQSTGQASLPPGAQPEASRFILDLAEKAITGLTRSDVSASERDQRFRELFHEGFDVPAIARFALGRHWRTASEAERAEYIKLFEELIIQTYSHRFTGYAGETLRVAGTRKGGEGEVVVTTELVRLQGPPVKVDWRVFRVGSEFKIYDIVVEGVSMSITQRDEFAALIQRQGGRVEGLLTALREKVRAGAKTN